VSSSWAKRELYYFTSIDCDMFSKLGATMTFPLLETYINFVDRDIICDGVGNAVVARRFCLCSFTLFFSSLSTV
jgi:hypothetical protein